MTTFLRSIFYIFLVLAIGEEAFCQLDFKDYINVPDEATPLEMVVGDFDNNDLRDIAYTTQSSGGLQVLLHLPTGEFEAINVPVLHGNSSVYPLASGDIDGDGNDDLVIFDNATQSSDKIILVRYDGEGFTSSRYPTGIFVSKDIEIIDFNGDGHLDIICASDGGSVEFLEGDGTGSFTTRLLPTDDVSYVTISVSDLNGDAKMDLVGGTYDNELVTYLSNGSSYIEKRYPVASQIASFVVQDFSGDQLPDVIASVRNSTSLYNYTNDGLGQLTLSNVGLPKSTWQGLDAADYDNDGRPDIIVGEFGPLEGITLMKNLGASGFQNILSSGFDTDYLIDMEFDDLDGNGTQEIVALSIHKKLDIYTLINGSYIKTKAMILGTLPMEGLIADLNLDGNNDLIAGSLHAKLISVYYGDGDGNFDGRRDFLADVELGAMEVGDFNGDDYPDIAWSTHPSAQPSRTALIMSTAEGLLQDHFTEISSSSADDLRSVDLDNDGDLDLISESNILKNNGTGIFTRTSYSAGVSTYLVRSGDLNGDGYADLVVGDRETNMRIALNNGAGSFGLFQTLDIPASTNFFEVVNLNNDTMMDIVLVHEADSKISVLTQAESGDYITKTISVDFQPRVTTTADFNQDGLTDIAVGTAGNAEESYLTILLQNSDGDFEPGPNPVLGTFAYGLANGDLNNDAKPDIAGFSPNGPGISILHNDLVLQPTLTSEINITALKSNSVSFILKPGDGNGRIVLFKEAHMVDVEPTDGIFYGSNAAFGVGSEIGNDNFVVRRGEDLATTVTALKEDTAII